MANDPRETLSPHLHRLLLSREYPKTICPSEVPRALTAAELKAIGASDWRDLMPQVRQMVEEMRQRNEVEILQRGEPVPIEVGIGSIKGPIRIRRVKG